MPIARFSRGLLAAIVTGSIDVLHKVVSLNGFKYGSLGEVPGAAGISSLNPRSAPLDTLIDQVMVWRNIASTAPAAQLSKVGRVQSSLDRGQEFDFEWSPTANTEDVVGLLSQADVTYGLASPNVPTTSDHGYVVDSSSATTNTISGLAQKVTPGGTLSGRTFTFSVYVAVPNATARTFAQNIRLFLGTSEDPPTVPTQGTQSSTSYASGRMTYLRVTKTFTFGSSPTNPTELMAVCSAASVSGAAVPMLFAAAQLEEAGAATAYERTSTTARGIRNLLLGSHFPTRAPWFVRVAGTAVVAINADAGRGPEVRAIVPTPGAIEFGSANTGVSCGNGVVQMRGYDAYGQVADKVAVIANGGAGIGQAVAGAGAFTYIFSCWIRAGTQTPTNNWYINIQGNTAGHAYVANQSIVFTPAMLSKAWRRVWVSWYIDAAVYPTIAEIQVNPFAALTTFAAGDNVEVWGCQLEKVSGNAPAPPANYQPTTSAPVGVNLLKYSEDMTNGVWASSNLTITANTGFAPIEYYDMVSQDIGLSANRLRINPGGNQSLLVDWHSIAAVDKGDLSGEAYSIGAYGSELMGSVGDLASSGASPNVITGWTVTGGDFFFLTSGGPTAWVDDEESTTPQGLRHTPQLTTSPSRYISTTSPIAFPVGWATIRLRVGRVVASGFGNFPAIALISPGGNHLGYDRVSFPDSTVRWHSAVGRDQGAFSPDFGVSVWHVYIPSAGNYTLRIGCAVVTAIADIYFDQLRIWTDAGALYASADRTETAGNCGFLMQGFDVLFRGVIDDSPEADDTKIKVRCRDYVHGTAQLIPQWTAQPNCQVKFRGLECGYVSTTTITVNEASPTTTHTVASTANLEAGRLILNSAGTGYTKIVSILNGTQFTTDVAQTYANAQAIKYADCKHTYPDCFLRQRTFAYSGCRATQALQAQGGTPLFHTEGIAFRRYKYDWHSYQAPALIRSSAAQLLGAIGITSQESLNEKKIYDDVVIPLVYGRKSVKGIPIETHATKYATDNSEWLTTFYLIAMGEIADVRLFFTQDGPIVHDATAGIAVYWHPGRHGEDAWWTLTDHTALVVPLWIPSTAYSSGTPSKVIANGNVYVCATSGTSAASPATGPSGTGSGIADGTAIWNYVASAQKIDNQERDFRTNTDNAYNRMGYFIVQIKKGNPLVDLSDPTKIIEAWADVKGRMVQAYDATGSPIGNPSWSRNPIWIAVDGLLNGVFGPALPFSIIDWPTMAASAAICDVTLTSPVAITQVRTVILAGINSNVQGMVGIDGFAPEMAVTITHSAFSAWVGSTVYTAGTSYVLNASRLYVCITSGTSAASGGPTTTAADITDGTAHWQYLSELTISRTIKFIDPINLRLFFDSAFTAYTGDVIQGFPKRYTCDLIIDSKVDLRTFLDLVMGSCRGFLTFDNGKVGIGIERSASDTTMTTWHIQNPTQAATLLGVIPGSVEYIRPTFSNFNMLELTYECAQLLAGSNRVLKFYDADRGGRDFPRPLKLEATGCDTAEQALRALLPRFAKTCSEVSNSDPSQDVRGLAVDSGIALLPAQVGDFVDLTRPTRTTSQKSRIRLISIDEKLQVHVETMPEARAIRPEGFSAPFDPFTDTPLIGTAMGSPLPLGTLTLSVTQSSGAQLHAQVSVAGYTAGPGTSAGTHLQRFVAYELHASVTPGFTPTSGRVGLGGTLVATIDPSMTEFVWVVPRLLQEIQLYVKAVGLQGGVDNQVVLSNEVPVVIYRIDRVVSDPTQQERSNFNNMLYGGGFRDSDGWISDAATPTYPGTLIFAASIGNPVSPHIKSIGGGATNTYQTVKIEDNTTSAGNTHLGKLSDALDSTYLMHTSTFQGPLPGTYVAAEGQLWNFSPAWVGSTAYTAGISTVSNAGRVYVCITSGTSAASGGPTTTSSNITDGTAHWAYAGDAGTAVGRPYFRYLRPTQAAGNLGTISLYYSLDVTIGTPIWTLLADLVGSPNDVGVDFTGPELTGIDYAKFGLGVRFAASQQVGTGLKSSIHRLLKSAFEQKTPSAYAGSISGGIATIYGDGTNFGNLRRPFPGKVPQSLQVIFNSSTVNHVRFQLMKHVATDTLDANGIEVRIYDLDNPANSWSLDVVPSSQVSSVWQDFATKFSPSSQVVGTNLVFEIRTLNTKAVDVRRVGVYRGDTICAWAPSVEEQKDGFHGDFSLGEPTGFTKGTWSPGDRKRSPVS